MKRCVGFNFFVILIFCSLVGNQQSQQPAGSAIPMYFCSVADEKHFNWLVHLIGSIHKFHFKQTAAIAVFDLGFTPQQRAYLNSIAKVTVRDLEPTNPDMKKEFNIWAPPQTKMSRGWFSWKPVAIKQALDQFPYVLYVDAGCAVLKPLDNLFAYIKQHGYCLFENSGPLKKYCSRHIMQTLCTKEHAALFEKPMIIGGVQGLSRAVYKNYVLPVYELTKDIRNFADDGGSPLGYGWALADQMSFSFYAHFNNFTLTPIHQPVTLSVGNKPFSLHVGSYGGGKQDLVWHAKGAIACAQHIVFKKTKEVEGKCNETV